MVGVQVLLVVVQLPVPCQELQPVQVDHTKLPVGAGHEAVRVRVRRSGRDCVISPTSPTGQSRVRVPVRVSWSVWVLGLGSTHALAHVVCVVAQDPVGLQPDQEDQDPQTADPVGAGHEAERERVRWMGRSW